MSDAARPRGPDQVIRVGPARETDRAHGMGGGNTPPARCYIMGEGRIEKVMPVTFDSDGYPSDVTWRPGHVVLVDRLLFTYGTHSFPLRIEPPVIVAAGQKFHLALRHMGLLDRFGRDYLQKARA